MSGHGDRAPQVEERQHSSAIIQAVTEQRQKAELAANKKKAGGKSGKKKGNDKMKEAVADSEAFRDMVEHKIPEDELFNMLGLESKEAGLSTDFVRKRLHQEGENKLTERAAIPWYVMFFQQLTGLFSLLLWLGAVLCFIGYGIDQSDPSYLWLGIVLSAVVLITGIFSYSQESKSASIMAKFKNFVPPKCTVLRDNGTKSKVETSQIVRGDIVLIEAGDSIPADIRILASNEMKVDNSSLTGESEMLVRTVECTNEDNPLETNNLAFFGTLCKEGTATAIVINIGDLTIIGRIAHLASTAENEDTPLKREIHYFIKIITGVALFLGITFFIIAAVFGYPYITNLVFCIGIIVANVPEGLLATVTVSLALTAKRMSLKAVLVKNLESVETLGSTTCICSDKTGTLTQNRMTVSHVWYDGNLHDAENLEDVGNRANLSYDPDNAGFRMLQRCTILCSIADFNAALPSIKDLTAAEAEALSESELLAKRNELTAAWNEELSQMRIQDRPTVGDASESGLIKFFHPLEDISVIRGQQPIAENAGIKAEIPFTSANKYKLSIHAPNAANGQGNENKHLLLMKGAPERIWGRCNKIYKNGQEQNMSAEMLATIEDANDLLGRNGERVLAFAYSHLDPTQFPAGFAFNPTDVNFPMEGLTFIGLISMQDPPRGRVPWAVTQCQSAGIKVIMVTGDQPVTAEAIAKQTNIITLESNVAIQDRDKNCTEEEAWDQAEAVVIHGDVLTRLAAEDDELPEEEQGKKLEMLLGKPEVVFARTSPAQKLIIVEGCQRIKHIVAVTGDGVNDSPAIKKADIGIAMGIVGTDVAKEAADMILLNDDFASIVDGVQEGRLIFDNLKKSIAYTLSSNIPEIGPFLAFIVLQIPLPLSTVLILCVDLGTDMVPAISLAYEQGELDIMRRRPRDAEVDHLVNARMISFSYLQIGVIQCLAGFYTYFFVLNDYGFPPNMLFFWALSEDGWKPKGDEPYRPDDHRCGGNENCLLDDDADKGERVNWNTDEHNDIDLRVWFGNHFDEDDWADCRLHDKSHASGERICYTTEALRHAQCAYFVSIVVVQWADLMICKTRKLSISQQGMRNYVLDFGILFETALACLLCYVPPLNIGLGTRDLNIWHLGVPSFPFFTVIFFYDELRKYLIRDHRERYNNKPGWVERNTYY